ncbi:MAG: YdeI/OmpD-associated family protein [Methanimicrococcus sp.]|nr:YdeI/OmpD-associated family protein [Methanimicrococcus sp.]
MPEDVRMALTKAGLFDLYEKRPPYQQNDYVGWISRAKKNETRLKRLNQMLEELKSGDKYMGMDYSARM